MLCHAFEGQRGLKYVTVEATKSSFLYLCLELFNSILLCFV